jgi:hypothetical protein
MVPPDKQRYFTLRLSVSDFKKLIGVDHIITCAPADKDDLFWGYNKDGTAFKNQGKTEGRGGDREIFRPKRANSLSTLRQMSNMVCKRTPMFQSYLIIFLTHG